MRRIAATLILALGLSGNAAPAAEISRSQCGAIIDAFKALLEYKQSRHVADQDLLVFIGLLSVGFYESDASEQEKQEFREITDNILSGIEDIDESDQLLVDQGLGALMEVCGQ